MRRSPRRTPAWIRDFRTAKAPGVVEALAIGRRVLKDGAAALQDAADALGAPFDRAVDTVFDSGGRLVVTGIGKAGFIARKISATFASTGTPSLFLHPSDALHGDLGRITRDDLALLLSHSGETEEIVRLLDPLKRLGSTVIALTATAESTLGREADLTLPMGPQEESGNGLAPTTSTTVMLGLGDALAMAVLERRGFTEAEFRANHPGGAIGRRLMRVEAVMRSGPMLPVAHYGLPLKDVIAVMTKTKGRPGAATIVDEEGRLIGLFTDGDLRRMLEHGRFQPEIPVREVMSRDPKVVHPDDLVVEAADLMRSYRVDQIPVVDTDRAPVGLLDVQDLLARRFL